MKLRVAARRSDLARAQAYKVASTILKSTPEVEIEFIFKKSLGDINLQDPLWKMPEKGVFTSDLSNDLKSGACDLVVHSWKDLPIETNPDSEIVATLTREDARDLLFFKKTSYEKLKNHQRLEIFSSSPRRVYNAGRFLENYLPWAPQKINFKDIRGNIPTRLSKYLADSQIDGIIVAKAAIDRMLEAQNEEYKESHIQIKNALEASYISCLPLRENPPAAAQGALAIEIMKHRQDLKTLLAKINCPNSYNAAIREREWLKSYGGGCHQKIGASVLICEAGRLEILKGESSSGKTLNEENYYSNREIPKKFPRSKIWPENLKSEIFRREQISCEQPSSLNALWVSRANALPEDWSIGPETLIWTSGIKTWKALSLRGIWVNGSCESMGENSVLSEKTINRLMNDEIQWSKLTHNDVLQSAEKNIHATYKLVPEKNSLNFSNFDAFYWSSGSQFEEAVKIDPTLLKRALHACGLGNSAEMLKKRGLEPFLYPHFEHFLKDFAIL